MVIPFSLQLTGDRERLLTPNISLQT
jgi:hypothetical protein